MATEILISGEEIAHRKELILAIFQDIQTLFAGSGYTSNKRAISKLFENTNEYVVANENKNKEEIKADILLRLTVIDSMYSTQMGKRYYGLDDLAKAMYAVQQEKHRPLKELFVDFAASPCEKSSLFNYKENEHNLFGDKTYGIGKHDKKPKGLAISLISKYAYFTTGYKFPIFDSIVCEMLPVISAYIGFSIKKASLKARDGMKSMEKFVTAINTTIQKLEQWTGKSISYDSFDRLLWFVGKIRRGNLSLILSKEEYEQFIDYLNEVKIDSFDIEKIDVNYLPFLNSGSPLKRFFQLAKELDSMEKSLKNKS